MPLRADDEQPALPQHPIVFGLPLLLGYAQHSRVAAKDDVRAAPRHIRCDGYGARPARLRYDVRLALMLLGVQYFVVNARLAQQPAQHFGLVDIRCANKHRLPVSAAFPYFAHHRAVLGVLVGVYQIALVVPHHRHIGGDFHHLELVNLPKLFAFG